MKTFILSSIAALTATGALAGSADMAPADPVIATPAPVAAAPMTGDWTGPYAGLSFGGIDGQTGGTSERSGLYGGYAGYDYDLGNIVVGGELEYQATDDLSVSGVDVDNVARLKARAGYDLGNVLVYGTAGAARIDTSVGTANGAVYGIGTDFKVTDSFSVGAELLDHRFKDVGTTNADVDAQSVNLRGTFRF